MYVLMYKDNKKTTHSTDVQTISKKIVLTEQSNTTKTQCKALT